jgi:hypothetical protein
MANVWCDAMMWNELCTRTDERLLETFRVGTVNHCERVVLLSEAANWNKDSVIDAMTFVDDEDDDGEPSAQQWHALYDQFIAAGDSHVRTMAKLFCIFESVIQSFALAMPAPVNLDLSFDVGFTDVVPSTELMLATSAIVLSRFSVNDPNFCVGVFLDDDHLQFVKLTDFLQDGMAAEVPAAMRALADVYACRPQVDAVLASMDLTRKEDVVRVLALVETLSFTTEEEASITISGRRFAPCFVIRPIIQPSGDGHIQNFNDD